MVSLAGITDTIIVRVDVQYVTCVGRGLAADVASMSACSGVEPLEMSFLLLGAVSVFFVCVLSV